jgi:hypothetical protein
MPWAAQQGPYRHAGERFYVHWFARDCDHGGVEIVMADVEGGFIVGSGVTFKKAFKKARKFYPGLEIPEAPPIRAMRRAKKFG